MLSRTLYGSTVANPCFCLQFTSPLPPHPRLDVPHYLDLHDLEFLWVMNFAHTRIQTEMLTRKKLIWKKCIFRAFIWQIETEQCLVMAHEDKVWLESCLSSASTAGKHNTQKNHPSFKCKEAPLQLQNTGHAFRSLKILSTAEKSLLN